MRLLATLLIFATMAGCYTLRPETDRRDGSTDITQDDALDARHGSDVAANDIGRSDTADVVSDDAHDGATDAAPIDIIDAAPIDIIDAVSTDIVDAVSTDLVDAVSTDIIDTGTNADRADVSDGGLPLPRIGAGRAHTCVLRTDGALRCWGANSEGQLGNRGVATMGLPVVVDQTFFDGADLEGELDTLFVRTASGFAWGWGLNSNGQLRASGSPRTSPVTFGGVTDVVSASVGQNHGCVARAIGTVECSGGTQYGQLGPGAMPGLVDAAEVSAGRDFSCARRRNRTVLCWGRNNYGQLGCGTVGDDAGLGVGYPPCPVVGLDDAVELSSHESFTCARRAGGSVVCWGRNNAGQLGDGTRLDRMSPVTVIGLSDVTTLSTGQEHACAVTSAGLVRCWGENGEGQLGNRSRDDAFTPVQVVGLSDVIDVACGWVHTCAAQRGGEVRCWGSNNSGEVTGSASTMDYLEPVTVNFPN